MGRITAILAFCLALSASAAHAGVYILITAATAVQTSIGSVTGGGTPGTNQIQNPQAIVGGPLENQAFVVWATGAIPSCTAQILGSNDGITWVNYGSTVTASATAGGSVAVANSAVGTIPFPYFAALVTAISGTGTKCFASLSG